jgi:predicted naringenin-chalcone synthase
MAWHVEDSGFAMTLDARLPARIRQWLREGEDFAQPGVGEDEFLWAVHPGGRLILDSVQSACGISDHQMHASREVLRRYGNMSSASIMFILRDILVNSPGVAPKQGRALAFGPGLTVERMEFTCRPTAPRPVRRIHEFADAV